MSSNDQIIHRSLTHKGAQPSLRRKLNIKKKTSMGWGHKFFQQTYFNFLPRSMHCQHQDNKINRPIDVPLIGLLILLSIDKKKQVFLINVSFKQSMYHTTLENRITRL
jgi:hypothetical protein